MSVSRLAWLPIAGMLALSACRTDHVAAAPVETDMQSVMPGKVTDLPTFERFIAGNPMPEAFYARYPDVRLVLPGSMTTKELRADRSRYFARLDDQGRIVGGDFK